METEVIRFQDVYERAEVMPPSKNKILDSDVIIECPVCKTHQSLNEATVFSTDGVTTYICKKECSPIAFTSSVADKSKIDKRFGLMRLGEFVIAYTGSPIIKVK